MKKSLPLFLSSLLLAASAARLAAQASAVDSMTTLGSTATVNTSFITTRAYWEQTVPPRSSGTYKRVYSCSGNWDDGMTSQSGTMPTDPFFWPDGDYNFETGKWYKLTTFDDGRFYIERYTENYNDSTGAVTWSKVLYRGPTTVAPTVSQFSVSATRLWQGQSLQTIASAADADYDLWWIAIGFRNPTTLAASYVGVSGYNYDSPSLSLNDTRVLAVPGRWLVTLHVDDWAFKTPPPSPEGAALGAIDVRWVEVLPAPLYDPSGNAYIGATAPTVTAPSGSNLRLTAGQSGLVPVTFRVAGVGAGKPVRVSLGVAGGISLFASSVGGVGVNVLELVTNSDGEVTVWVSAGTRERVSSEIYAQAGRGVAVVRTLVTPAADADNDGMSDAMETTLAGNPTAVAYTPAAPAIIGFTAFGP